MFLKILTQMEQDQQQEMINMTRINKKKLNILIKNGFTYRKPYLYEIIHPMKTQVQILELAIDNAEFIVIYDEKTGTYYEHD